MTLSIIGGQSGTMTADTAARINAGMRGITSLTQPSITGYGGNDIYALTTREMLFAIMPTVTEVTVSSGDMIINGRHVAIDEPTTVRITTGQIGMNRNDLIVVTIDTRGETDLGTISVIEGIPTTDTVVIDPPTATTTSGLVIADTDGTWVVPIYRVVVRGLDASLERLFDYDIALNDLADYYDCQEAPGQRLPGYGERVDSGTQTFNDRFKLWDGHTASNFGTSFNGHTTNYMRFQPNEAGTGGIIYGMVSYDPNNTYLQTENALMYIIPDFKLNMCGGTGPLDYPCTGISCINTGSDYTSVYGQRWQRTGVHIFEDGRVGVYSWYMRASAGSSGATFMRALFFRTWINTCSPRQYATWLAEQRTAASESALSN